jgi:Na+/proline symporter
MHLSPLDVAVVVAYILIIFGIALRANFYMRKHFLQKRKEGLRAIENHYLAGRSITFWEAMLSIIATEFSALAFLTIPTYVYFENLNYLRFVIGACISRVLISIFFLPRVYGKGLTIFEALARGIHGYTTITKEGLAGKRAFAFFYVLTKTVGTAVKLLGGALLVAEFFDISVFFAISLIAMMTYLYIMIGGLKAVVRTDMMQAGIFIFGGFAAHYVVGQLSTYSWGELFVMGWNAGKFSWFDGFGGFMTFLYGILAGVAYDAATHGVDQDLVQKLFGATDRETARKALAWSAFGSFFVNLLFLTLGVILWAYYTKHGQALPRPDKLFSDLIEYHFPSPLKGLMVASVLAASMSSLDSAINALSAVFWNDLMSVEKSRMFRVFINIDNFIITISIIIVSYLFSLLPGAIKAGLHFAYLSTGPLLAFFLCRMMLAKWIKVSYSPVLILVTVLSCFLGFGINHFTFGFNPQLTILWGLISTIAFMWIYSKIADFTSSKRVH